MDSVTRKCKICDDSVADCGASIVVIYCTNCQHNFRGILPLSRREESIIRAMYHVMINEQRQAANDKTVGVVT